MALIKHINWKIVTISLVLFIVIMLITIKVKAMNSVNKNIDEANFFKKIKINLFKTLSQSQVDGLNIILNEWKKAYSNYPIEFLAYMLATTYHETARTMQPINEYGKGANKKYGTKTKLSGAKYTTPNKLYYGRGFVQLTWFENYDKMGKLLGLDLLSTPELALDARVATNIMFLGMIRGDFTGRSLKQYFNGITNDFVNARRIINGTDKAQTIAGYAKEFLNALK